MATTTGNNDFQTKVLSGLEELKIRVAVIESKVNDDLKTTKEKADEAFITASQNKLDIAELKDKNKWLSRTIAAAIIGGLIALVFTFIKII